MSDAAHDGLPIQRWRFLAANGVWTLHCAVTGFFTIAWTLPWQWALWTALGGAILMTVQWRMNDGLCILTKLERGLRGLDLVPCDVETNFIQDIMHRVSGRRPSKRFADVAAYGMLWGGAAVAAVRLALS